MATAKALLSRLALVCALFCAIVPAEASKKTNKTRPTGSTSSSSVVTAFGSSLLQGLSPRAVAAIERRFEKHLERNEQLVPDRVSDNIVTLSRKGFDFVEIFRLWDNPRGPDAGVVVLSYGDDKATMTYQGKRGRRREFEVVHMDYSNSEGQKGYLLKSPDQEYFFADRENPNKQSFRFKEPPIKMNDLWIVDLGEEMQSIIPFDQILELPVVVFRGTVRDWGDFVKLPSPYGSYLARKDRLAEHSPEEGTVPNN